MQRWARLTAVSLATQTQPFGTGVKAKHLGEKATASDVRRVYILPSNVYGDIENKKVAAGYWGAVKKGDWARADAIMRKYSKSYRTRLSQVFDGGAAHQKCRNKRGKVPRKFSAVFVVRDVPMFKAYLKKEVDLVGFAKSGWASCARALGGVSGIPKWVTRHRSPARVLEVAHPAQGKYTVTMINQVRYASEVLSLSQKKEAVQIAASKLFKALVREIHKAPAALPMRQT